MYNTLIIVSRFISKASTEPIMKSEARSLVPMSLRYWKEVYHGYITIDVENVSTFPAEN